MGLQADVNTPFAIDIEWWQHHNRRLERLLADILGEDHPEAADGPPLDYIDPDTAEVHQVPPLWARVLIERASQPDYLSSSIPLATAIVRTLIANLNRPMTATQIYRRVNRTSPETILRLLRAAEDEYGIVPVAADSRPRQRSRGAA